MPPRSTRLGELHAIGQFAGFVADRHIWTKRLRSCLNVSVFAGDNDASITGGFVNRDAQSYSANLLHSPKRVFTVGVELMHARRILENGTDGTSDRLQLSGRHDFGYTAP